MSSNKKVPASESGLQNKFRNITDTNLLLLITIVVFFVMYIGAIIFQGAFSLFNSLSNCSTRSFAALYFSVS